jgi:hypothetical protein
MRRRSTAGGEPIKAHRRKTGARKSGITPKAVRRRSSADAVHETELAFCEARVVDIAIVDNEVFRIAASFGELGRLSKGDAAPLDRSSVTGRSICDLQPVQVADIAWRKHRVLVRRIRELLDDQATAF